MLCLNGWSWGGRYHGSGMDAVRERMESVPAWMLCMKDGVGLDFISVPAWMLCASGWGRSGRYHGPGMDALREQMGSGWTIVRLHERMESGGKLLYGSAMDAVRERMGSCGMRAMRALASAEGV